jgi:hypothetical protein
MVFSVKRSFRSVRFDVRRSICSEALRRCLPRKLCPGPAKVTVLAPNAKLRARSAARSCEAAHPYSDFRCPRLDSWHLDRDSCLGPRTHSIGPRNSVRSSHDARATASVFVYHLFQILTQDAPCAVASVASVGDVTGDVYPSAMSFLAQTANRVVDEDRSAKRGGNLGGQATPLIWQTLARLNQSAVSVRLAARSPRAAAASTRAKPEVHGKDPPPLRHFPCYRRPIRRTSPRPC